MWELPVLGTTVTIGNIIDQRSAFMRTNLLTNCMLIPLTAVTLFLWVGCEDEVHLANTSGQENGLLVDGRDGSGDFNDRVFKSADAVIGVGVLQEGTSNEVVAFTNLRPPAIDVTNYWTKSSWWNLGGDDLYLNYQNQIKVPVTVWIVKGPFDTQRTRAIDACITTTNIWRSERMGLGFSPFEIIDATDDSEASDYYTFTCSKQSGIQNDIGQTTGRINIYYVGTVDGSTSSGQACSIGSDFVAMGQNTGDELLSHELGHNFYLYHVNALTANFDQTNIMHNASNTRAFITEGQVFRAHLNPKSAINDTYNARPGMVTRTCGQSDANDGCPAIQKRIWADGTYPAN